MALELKSDYFNTSDGNAMSVDDRIKNAFAAEGKVSYKGVVYDSEVEFRNILIKEGILKKDGIATDVIKKSASQLLGLFLACGISALLLACSGNSKNEVNVPTEYCEELVKLAEDGNAEAQYILGLCLFEGKGVEQSFTETAKWYQKAAEQGFVSAQGALGDLYLRGMGVTKSYTEAVKWYQKAAEQGEAHSQNNLGKCYNEGLGVAQSYTEAFKWYQKAAEQGYPIAQYNLGLKYYNGEGVTQSYTEAVKWLKKAAEQGYIDAKSVLYNMGYESESNVSLDRSSAILALKETAQNLQDTCPAKYPNAVMVENVTYEDNIFTYYYLVPEITVNSENENETKEAIKSTFRNNDKSKRFIEALIKSDSKLIYHYRTDGGNTYDIVFNPYELTTIFQ